MSSPNGHPSSPHWQLQPAQPAAQTPSDENEEPGVAIKSMRLKVLYTFDDQSKTNCLARWPQVLQIRTVAMDETTSIGVIELKICIQAIVQCSPELVAKLGQDYTVYAYDYSEFDNPLVGQGMLSWALAAAAPTPDAPVNQSKQLITGRICKNIQGLFSNGVAETLEVKLRLVPVPTVLQSEYVHSMEKYRELSKILPPGFDHSGWLNFLQSTPNIAQVASKISAPTTGTTSHRDGISMEVVNQLLSPSLTHNSTDPFNNPQASDISGHEVQEVSNTKGKKASQNSSRPSSRASVKRPYKRRTKAAATGGNTSGYDEGTDGDDGPGGKKRAKITKADWNSKSSFGVSSDSLRVTASTAGSLRLFRPIALAPEPRNKSGSHLQEIPRAPTPVPNFPPQPSACGPAPSQSGLRRDSIISQYLESQPRQYSSPYQQFETGQDVQDCLQLSIESAMTSPEKNDSHGETPPEFRSSPPLLRTASPFQFTEPPSSPVLPQMPRNDSGFMGGGNGDLFDDDEMRPIEEADIAVAAQYSSRRRGNHRPPPAPVHYGFAIEEVTPGPPELLPTKMLPRTEPRPRAEPKPRVSRPRTSTRRAGSIMSDQAMSLPAPESQEAPELDTPALPNQVPAIPPPALVSKPKQLATGVQPAAENQNSISAPQPTAEPKEKPVLEVQPLPNSLPDPTPPVNPASQPASRPVSRPASRMLSRTASVGSLTLPTAPASDPPLPAGSAQNPLRQFDTTYPATDIPAASDGPDAAVTISAATIIRKNLIRKRLEAAIEKGEMPPYCSNCGAIDTPTWRKAWTQDCKGDPGYHQYSDEPGRVTAIDILERDEDEKPIAYKLYKKSLGTEEDKSDFSEILLCNPCGIWLSKYKTQRPEDKWVKDHERAQERLGLVEKKPAERRKRERPSKSKKSQSGYQGEATSEANFQSDALDPYDIANANEASNDDKFEAPSNSMSNQEKQPPKGLQHSGVQSAKRTMRVLSPNITSAALRRAVQSSPARWLGTQYSPIEVEEELGSTRRLLFPSPRRNESSGVLGEIATNVNEPPVSLFSPQYRSKDLAVETSDKENRSPGDLFDDGDDELRRLFEEEMTQPTCPSTPIQKAIGVQPFKTPSRPTPNHRPVTRSVSKSAKSANRRHVPPQRTPGRTPSSAARRRSPRNHRTAQGSPFTATLTRLLSEGDRDRINIDSPSHDLDLGLDFSGLPDIDHSGANGINSDALTSFHVHGFGANHNFFSTDIAMPSSPPRFDFFEDPLTTGMDGMHNSMWSDFNLDDSALQSMGQGLIIDDNGHATFDVSKTGMEDAIKTKAQITSTVNEDDLEET